MALLVDTIALAIPAYNEADGIGEFLTDLDDVLAQVAGQHWFVVVNDQSTDNTVAVLEGLEPSLVGVLLLSTNDQNSGHGPTVINAYHEAMSTGADWVLQVDGDGQFEAEAVTTVLQEALSGNHDVVTGARDRRFDPWYRTVLTSALPLVLRLAFKVKRGDVNCPFRLYRTETLNEILADIPSQSVTPHVLMTVVEDRVAASHAEVTVTHRPRRGDTEVGSTWQGGRALVVPGSLVRLCRRAVSELGRFWKDERSR